VSFVEPTRLCVCAEVGGGLCPRRTKGMPSVALNPDLNAKLMLTMVLDALPVGLFWKDRDSIILGCNRKFAEDSGVSDPADMVGKTNLDFYAPAQAEAYRADDLEVITTGRYKLGIEESLLLATGETAWVETNKVPLRNDVGEIIGVLGTYRDVTEIRRAQNERVLRLAPETFRHIIDALLLASGASLLWGATG
jgi:PAS domain S-box-containing protein